jgi:hypothetical protein
MADGSASAEVKHQVLAVVRARTPIDAREQMCIERFVAELMLATAEPSMEAIIRALAAGR